MEQISQNKGAETEKPEIGPFIGLVIILALIIIGSLYFWGARLSREKVEENRAAVIDAIIK